MTKGPGRDPVSRQPKNRRNRAIAALAVAACTIAAGCGSGTTDQSGAAELAANDPQSVSGTITWWDTSDATNEAPAFKDLVAKFEQKYPNIEVNYVNKPFDGADDKFRTAAQNGDGAPDVMRADVGWTSTFAALGYLQPLDGTPALSGEDDYLPTPMGSTKYQGKTYGVPEVTDTLALLYNKELFEKAGIEGPPKDWAELEAAAKKIEAEVPGTTGVFLNADAYFLLPFVYGQGADYVDTDTKSVTIDSPQVASAIETVRELTSEGTGATDTSSNKYTNMLNSFKSGTTAMMLNGPWAVSDILTGSAYADPGNLGVASVPSGPQGQGGPVGGHNLVVYAGSPNLAASYLFVEFMSLPENQAYVTSRNDTLPTRKSAYELPEVKSNPVVAAFEKPLDGAVPRPEAPGAGDLYDIFTPFYEQILGDQVSIEDGLVAAQSKAKGAVPGFES
ncbi:sugar ABC transporter substrate-binding protein [Prauserella marina]|uniref:Arabinogalactan oligomer / maltooligosaccharide transport system substrate-binding protein n=1 Tax=Prauserella marina TaxID=530584 RepID=A0A222VXM8_9PSEU|nr:extracellular solute-binding protein [Prauserella marina]ASR38572.1 sugar ABC transporter substrate-binding protein [Prauserella marina]PWV81890.1 carbohydrate ABC transporter substrate-binding protein (CUT1 family) [Prauserella marina]SDD14690.1 arabinogalactan oligomer / maltooligosaccharide transport system substrate-binding protein [Prauserella marina]